MAKQLDYRRSLEKLYSLSSSSVKTYDVPAEGGKGVKVVPRKKRGVQIGRASCRERV